MADREISVYRNIYIYADKGWAYITFIVTFYS